MAKGEDDSMVVAAPEKKGQDALKAAAARNSTNLSLAW
jgi:hypothetical protein